VFATATSLAQTRSPLSAPPTQRGMQVDPMVAVLFVVALLVIGFVVWRISRDD
jgi:hypothetical protein